MELLAITLLINRDTGAPLKRALELARRVVASTDGSIALGGLGSLGFDLTRLKRLLQEALADALDDHVAPRRGRPRRMA